MKNVATYVEVGKTRSSVSGSTIAGAFLDDKASKRAVQRAIFNTNQRTLRRKKQVWVCGEKACMRQISNNTPNPVGSLIIGIIALAFVGYFFGFDRTDRKSGSQEEPFSASLPSMPDLASDHGTMTESAAIDEGHDEPGIDESEPPFVREAGTCYLKPGTTNVIVTDWDDKKACAVSLGLAAQ